MRPEKRVFTASTVCLMIWRCFLHHQGGAMCSTLTERHHVSLLRKYPVQIFNWHAWESLPEIGEAQALTGKCIMAGLERMDITGGRKNEIEYRIYETLRQTGGGKSFYLPAV